MSQLLTRRKSWRALAAHHKTLAATHLRELFAADQTRGERLNAEAAGLYLDYSKNRVTDETLRLLLALAEECGLRARIEAMFRGDKINITENRAVLHTALRAPRAARIIVDGLMWCRMCMRCWTHARVCRAGPRRRLARPHRQAASAPSSTSASAVGSRPGHGL